MVSRQGEDSCATRDLGLLHVAKADVLLEHGQKRSGLNGMMALKMIMPPQTMSMGKIDVPVGSFWMRLLVVN